MITSIAYNQAFKNYTQKKVNNGHTDALSEGQDGCGGYIIPRGFKEDYTAALNREDLFRRYATVLSTPLGDGHIQAIASTGEAEIVDASHAYPENNDTFTTYNFHAYKLAALTKIYNNFISDEHFDVQSYLNNEFARRFGRAEENVFLNGNGTNEPTGLLKTAEIGVSTNSEDTVTYDDIVKLYFSVKPEYRKNGVWLVNDDTAFALRSIKDSTGRYIWRDNDDTIFGRPVIFSQYMPSIEMGKKPIAFGDLSYYWVLERQPLSLKVLRELFLLEDMTGFAASEFVDGRLIRTEAVKVIQMNTTEPI